ncbi:MAG: hypothetical protein ABDI19_04745 [Armatimonadota bacterium]
MVTSQALPKPPQFEIDSAGKPTAVRLETAAYIQLLVRANITDPAFWPPGMEAGAEALARIREIEAECIAQHGEFDWEKLPSSIQDEYDALCALLDRLQDEGDRVALRSLIDDEARVITITQIAHRREVYG